MHRSTAEMERKLPDLENSLEKSNTDLQNTCKREAELVEEVCISFRFKTLGTMELNLLNYLTAELLVRSSAVDDVVDNVFRCNLHKHSSPSIPSLC